MQKAASKQTLTAEQVIVAYKALPPEEQKKVWDELAYAGTNPQLRLSVAQAIKLFYSRKKRVKSYLTSPNQPWHLNALFGDETVEEAIKENGGVLDGAIIKKLLAENPLPFHVDQTQQYLFMGKSEVQELDFGPLTPINSIIALDTFGLAKMEEANERGYARL